MIKNYCLIREHIDNVCKNLTHEYEEANTAERVNRLIELTNIHLNSFVTLIENYSKRCWLDDIEHRALCDYIREKALDLSQELNDITL